jgi:putative copper export protein
LAAESGGGAIWTGLEAARMHAALSTQAGKLGAIITVVAVLQLLALGVYQRGAGVLIASGALIIGLLALSGHSAYARYTPLTVTLDVAHIAAAAIWLGGLIELGYVALADRPQLWTRARLFAPFGFAAAATLAATGLYAAWIHVEHWSALTGTPYGRTVLVKSGLFLGALAFGAFNHLTTRRGHSRWGSITLEPGVLAMIVAVASVLVNVAPPPPTAQAAAAAPLSAAPPLAGAGINVAAPAGPTIIAVAASPHRLQVSAIRYDDKPASDAHLAVQHDPALHFAHCGSACLIAPWRPTRGRQNVSVLVSERGAQHRVNFDLPWPPGRDRSALLDTAIRQMTKLRSVRLHEIVSSGFGGSPAITRGVYLPGRALRLVGDNGFGLVTIGATSWQRAPNGQTWQRLAKPQRIDLFANYAQQGAVNVRELSTTRVDGRRVTVLGYWVPGQQYWYRLWIDPARRLILQDQIITPGHYLTDRYDDFNRPMRIRPPSTASP